MTSLLRISPMIYWVWLRRQPHPLLPRISRWFIPLRSTVGSGLVWIPGVVGFFVGARNTCAEPTTRLANFLTSPQLPVARRKLRELMFSVPRCTCAAVSRKWKQPAVTGAVFSQRAELLIAAHSLSVPQRDQTRLLCEGFEKCFGGACVPPRGFGHQVFSCQDTSFVLLKPSQSLFSIGEAVRAHSSLPSCCPSVYSESKLNAIYLGGQAQRS